jgi:chromosome segregation ATPase
VLKRQKLTTGKKKETKFKENVNVQKESRNPFKDFLDNLGDKSKGFADSVRKERDELIAKFKAIKGNEEMTTNLMEHREEQKKNAEVQTENEESKEENSDYLADVMKISQLSEELTKKNEYLEKSENKIVKLKEEISEYKDQIKNLNKETSILNDVVKKLKEKEEHFIQEITDINNKVNFLQLENNMHVQQKQKFLSECPQDTRELDQLKIVPKDKYNLYKKSYKQYKILVKNMKFYERKIMSLQVSNSKF